MPAMASRGGGIRLLMRQWAAVTRLAHEPAGERLMWQEAAPETAWPHTSSGQIQRPWDKWDGMGGRYGKSAVQRLGSVTLQG